MVVLGRLRDYRQLRFVIVGLSSTASYILILGGLQQFFLTNPIIANSVGVVVAGVISYIGHKVFTFRSKAPVTVSLPRFLVQFFVVLGGTTLIAQSFIKVIGVWPTAIIVSIAIPIINYFVLRIWTFRQ